MCSICLTIYATVLFLYGCPHLRYSDSLEQFTEYKVHPKIFLAAFIGILTACIIHIPIVWKLRLNIRLIGEAKKLNSEKSKTFNFYQDSSDLWDTVCW